MDATQKRFIRFPALVHQHLLSARGCGHHSHCCLYARASISLPRCPRGSSVKGKLIEGRALQQLQCLAILHDPGSQESTFGEKGAILSGITKPQIDEYMNNLLPKRDPVFAEMEKLAEKEDIPIIGPAVARLLFLLTKVSGATRIFEMGSAIGYSAIWFALATGPKGEIFYTEGDPKNELRARQFAKRAGVEKRIKFMVGDALEWFEKVPGKFDMVFIDVHKPQYPAALKMAVPRLKRGGLLLADNTLWQGQVFKTTSDPSNRAIQQFNKMVYASRELFPVIVPLRDGLTICQKL